MLEERSPETPPTWIQYTIALEPYVNRINLIRAATNHIVSNVSYFRNLMGWLVTLHCKLLSISHHLTRVLFTTSVLKNNFYRTWLVTTRFLLALHGFTCESSRETSI